MVVMSSTADCFTYWILEHFQRERDGAEMARRGFHRWKTIQGLRCFDRPAAGMVHEQRKIIGLEVTLKL
jgi:hypothetical protein